MSHDRRKKSNMCAPGKGSYTTHAAIVRAYRTEHQENASREMRFFSIQKTLSIAIELAANAKLPGGKKHSHQWRIPNAVLSRFASRLQRIEDEIQSANDFYGLWALVRREGKRINGIGELAIYDTAHRIGAFLKLEPEFVYLHAGTRAGARVLGLPVDSDYLRLDQLPPELRRLKPYEAEDCLCIYKTQLAAVHSRN